MEFKKLIEARRSANNFLPDVQITQEDLKPIFEDVKLTPSAFNLQHTEYVVVMDEEMKEQVHVAAYGQYKVQTAAAVLIVLADRYAYRQTERLNQGIRDLGILKDYELEERVHVNSEFYETRGEQFMKEDAIRNASLSAMTFMLAAKNRGWDTCPLIGFDQNEIRKLLNVPGTHEIALMIAIGKEKESSRRLRGYRKPVGEFVSYY
ncbi:nitroreductase family protein [Virgibacillus sp. C22-A2]|uniref:Nitroreductase family protein n=1 Tax=Virgibacillus tibetensis TaxID=3042313 RepID=A0ABU6KDU1_9BACI|nr:nitroreductase family protein [Virgibacillus sp. C22-A2]